MRTLLFDIDGTLLTAAGGGKQAMRMALRYEFRVADPTVALDFHGRTDTGLMLELLGMNGVEPCEENRRRFRRSFARYFPEALTKSGGRVFPGVPELLDQLSRSGDCRVAVMTGNLPETASRKLEHFQLRHYVDWIIGGDLDAERNDLAARARAHVQRRHGIEATKNLVVIGDTVADIVCGRAIGAEVVAVCTGGATREQLQAAGPDAIWNDFSDVRRAARCLMRGEQGIDEA